MSDIDILESVLDKDVRLLTSVRPEQLADPVPTCPDYDVKSLVNHMVGGIHPFAASAQGEKPETNIADYVATDAPAEFRAAADRAVEGWRTHGTDRTVTLFSSGTPAEDILSMTMMEYVTHGIDLAQATAQDVPFSDTEMQATLERAKRTLPDEYRKGGMFGPRVDVAADAPALHQLLGFMGRHPR